MVQNKIIMLWDRLQRISKSRDTEIQYIDISVELVMDFVNNYPNEFKEFLLNNISKDDG